MKWSRALPILILSLVVLLGGLSCGKGTGSPASGTTPLIKGKWTVFTDGNQIRDLLIVGDDLWAATEGGVVRWNMEKGTYQKYTTADGLMSNSVQAIAQDAGFIWSRNICI